MVEGNFSASVCLLHLLLDQHEFIKVAACINKCIQRLQTGIHLSSHKVIGQLDFILLQMANSYTNTHEMIYTRAHLGLSPCRPLTLEDQIL
jgi:hypothetical protein